MPEEFTDRCMFPDHDPREDELAADDDEGDRISHTYTCAKCGETFESDRPDDQALEESRERFGEMPLEELAVVCDDCFKEVMNREEVLKTMNAPEHIVGRIEQLSDVPKLSDMLAARLNVLPDALAELKTSIHKAMAEIDELRKYDARLASVQAAVAWAIEDELDMDYGPGQIGNALDEGRRKPLDITKWMGESDGE